MFGLILSLVLLSRSEGMLGKQIVREVFPDPLHSNIDFGVGYNSITVSRTGTAAVNVTNMSISPRTSSDKSAFISHTFQIKYFEDREELKEEYGRDSEITKLEGYVGSGTSKFLRVLMADNVNLLDSVLTVDVDIVSDTESVMGQVLMGKQGKDLLDAGDFDK